MKNPWRRDMKPKEHGRAVIHVSPDAGPIKFSKAHLVGLVKKAVRGGTVTFAVGIWEGEDERTSEVLLINGGSQGVLRWKEFEALAKDISAGMCQALMQHATILELWTATGRYRAHTFENDLGPAGVEEQRKAAASLRRTRRAR